MIDFKEKYKDLICEDIPVSETRDPETGAIPQGLNLFDIAERTVENGFVEQYCVSKEEAEQLRRIRKIKNDTICIVIGEPIPEDRPKEYYKVDLYKRNESGEIELYANITLPYIINHAELSDVDIENDPRYYLYEGYETENGGCRYRCMIKPYGEFKGVYRLGLTYPIKIRDINVLVENNQILKRK